MNKNKESQQQQEPFTIKRKNLTALKQKKEGKVDKDKDKEVPAATTTTTTPAPAAATPTKVDVRYKKREPLTPKEQSFLKDFYYKKSGMAGRDALFYQLQEYYEKNNTPKKDRVSRRRMWEFFLERQEVTQLHKKARKSSIVIRPINAMYKLDRGQADLIIKGGDSARTYKGVLNVIDVATRKAWSEVLKGTSSKAVAAAFEKILGRIEDELPETDKQDKKKRKSKSTTFSVLHTDNGSEFKAEFSKLLESRGIKQMFGVSNKSTSQALVERFNQTQFTGIQKEITATGGSWYELVRKHTDMYNNKPNRNLRLKEEEAENYTIYTPNKLWVAGRDILSQLYSGKNSKLNKQKKNLDAEREIKVGDEVRRVDFAKRKGDLTKGYKQSWSKELYTVYKTKAPPTVSSAKPYLYYLAEKDSGKQLKDKNGSPIPHTINDIQKIRGGVEQAPSDIQVKQDNRRVTRADSKKNESKSADEDEDSAPTKDPEPEEKDGLIGKRIKMLVNTNGLASVTGTVVNKRKTSGVWKYKVLWDKQYRRRYKKEHEYIAKSKVTRLLV